MPPTTTTLKTGPEIRERIESYIGKRTVDFLGFRRQALLEFLPWEDAEGIRADGVSEDEWRDATTAITEEAVRERLLEYLEFAIGKAEDHRGISAERSIEKLSEWLWILGDLEALGFVNDDANYPNYGAPALKYIAERYGYDLEAHFAPHEPDPNGSVEKRLGVEQVRKNLAVAAKRDREEFERMAIGEPCRPDCNEGCGR